MPQKVNTQDETNFLKDGYVSRTQATRDGAGNIKLYEDINNTTNATIMVEPVTSQFSVETALKLFETRFEYFKFPVQTVDAGSFIAINNSIDQEVANTLAGVSFEQDVITRRMELVPLVEGSDVVEWLVPTPWTGINFNDLDASFKGDAKSALKGNYLNSFKNNVLRTVDNKTVWSGFRRIPMSNGNSPRGNGWLRITPDMLNQLQRGGKLKSTKKPMDPNYAPWKRNIKIKFTISWVPDNNVINSFKGENGHYADFDVNTVNFHSGVCLFVRLVTTPWTDTWNKDETYNEPEQPLFIQSTRDINWTLVTRDLQKSIDDTTPAMNRQITDPNQSMTVEYVFDSNELLDDLNKDPNITEYRGIYRDFALEAISNHPSIITECIAEISVEELPDDYIDDPGFGWDVNSPKESYGRYLTKDAAQLKYDQFRSLFGKFTYRKNWFSGVRRIDGKYIIAAQQGESIKAIGGTNKDSNWYRMYDWTGYKWDISKTGIKYTINTNLLTPGYGGDNYTTSGKLTSAANAFTDLDTIVNVEILGVDQNQVTTTQDKSASITSLTRVQGDLTKDNTRILHNKIYSGTDYPSFPLTYTGGNGGAYDEIVIASTNYPGITYVIPAGKLANGDGKLQGYIRGKVPEVNSQTRVTWDGKAVLGFDVTNLLYVFIDTGKLLTINKK